MFTGSLDTLVHDLVIVLAYIGALLSGYAGMTVWARKGGRPGGGFLVGGLLGALGVFILVLAKPRQTEIDSVARSRGLVACPHCAESIKREARACWHCQRDVAPSAVGSPV
jgi:ribosomal protein L37AE/L43A